MSDSWSVVVIGVMPFAVVYLWLGILDWRRPSCPECGTRAPVWVSPFAKTKRQWIEGGWTCSTCGIDVDTRGQMVAPGTGPRPGWAIRSALLIVPPALLAVGLLCFGFALSRQNFEPPLAPGLPRAVPDAVPEPALPVDNDLR